MKVIKLASKTAAAFLNSQRAKDTAVAWRFGNFPINDLDGWPETYSILSSMRLGSWAVKAEDAGGLRERRAQFAALLVSPCVTLAMSLKPRFLKVLRRC